MHVYVKGTTVVYSEASSFLEAVMIITWEKKKVVERMTNGATFSLGLESYH